MLQQLSSRALTASTRAAAASASASASASSSASSASALTTSLLLRPSASALFRRDMVRTSPAASTRRVAQLSRHLSTSQPHLSMSPSSPRSASSSPPSGSNATGPLQDELPVQLLASGPVRTLRLNRPKALNALNLEMVKLLINHLDAIAPTDASGKTGSDAPIILLRGEGRALCSGGDVLAVVNAANSDDPAVRKQSLDFFHDEYWLDYRIATLARSTGKLFISIMDGITMGGGVGLSLHAPFRIATERTLFAMPETGIGFFPDVGVTRILGRLDGPGASVGKYLGLTGARITGEEAYLAGLATHFVPSSSIDALVHRLETLAPETARDINTVDAVLSEFATNPLSETYASSSTTPSAKWAESSALLGARRVALDWAFGASRADAKAVVAALESLAANSEEVRSDKALLGELKKAGFGSGIPSEAVSWAQETLKALRTKSPRSVVISHLLIQLHYDSVKGLQELCAKNRGEIPTGDVVRTHPTARYQFVPDAFRLDMALAARFCDLSLGRDFYEGVTFTLTKDPATGKRRQGVAPWADARIEDIDVALVQSIFFGRTSPGSYPREGSAEFAVPTLDTSLIRTPAEGTPVGPAHWVPAFNAFALPSEAELEALTQGSHPAAGSVAIVDPEEIVSVLSRWRTGKRPLNVKLSAGSRSAGDGDKLGMLEKVREWSARAQAGR
ncbi:3-hydroxyisobutyryl-CoA hydrolase [Tilletia horrida]|nr:3-hydroxyisobutyryl-CoA hydrolase [Tilletia horrida]